MPLLIRNARILTLGQGSRPRRGKELSDLGILPVGEVLIADGKVSAVGSKIEAPPDAEIIEANGRVLTPGFVDCHTHACWAGDRLDEWGMKRSGVPYLEILAKGGGIMATVREVRAASRESLAEALLERLWGLLREGTTTIEVKS